MGDLGMNIAGEREPDTSQKRDTNSKISAYRAYACYLAGGVSAIGAFVIGPRYGVREDLQ